MTQEHAGGSHAHPTTIPDEELYALLDGRLDAATRKSLLERIEQDPAASQTLAALSRQRLALRELHAQVLQEPVPDTLTKAALQVSAARQSWQHWQRLGGMAAGVVLAFGLGWLARDLGPGASSMPAATLARAEAAPQRFVRQAAMAYAVFTPEVRHPVEVESAQQEHLAQWLSKRLGRPIRIVGLQDAGYALLGGRLLPGEDGTRAQFMYQSADGKRITLYLGAVAAASTLDRQETAFRFAQEGKVASFYWVDQGFGYALSGELPRPELMTLAQLVYQQL